MIEAETEILRDLEVVAGVGVQLSARYGDSAPEALAAVRAQVPKRVALHFIARRIASWDHRKLGATH